MKANYGIRILTLSIACCVSANFHPNSFCTTTTTETELIAYGFFFIAYNSCVLFGCVSFGCSYGLPLFTISLIAMLLIRQLRYNLTCNPNPKAEWYVKLWITHNKNMINDIHQWEKITRKIYFFNFLHVRRIKYCSQFTWLICLFYGVNAHFPYTWTR